MDVSLGNLEELLATKSALPDLHSPVISNGFAPIRWFL
jgi:hypothetical protein